MLEHTKRQVVHKWEFLNKNNKISLCVQITAAGLFDILTTIYHALYNNQINARALIGQSAMVYCAGEPTEKSRVFWIII